MWYNRSKERRMLDKIISSWQGNELAFHQAEQRVFLTGDKMINYTYNEGTRINKKITDKSKLEILLSFFAEFLASSVSVAVLIYILLNALGGTLLWTIGELTIAITGYSRLIRRFSNASNYFTSMFISSKEVGGFLELSELEDDQEGTIDEVPLEKVIHVKNLCFTYPGTNVEILHNVTFDLGINEHIAFVGRNGSGKSTMVKLLLGLYQPTSGEITIGGHSIRDYTYSVRKKIFGVQFQDYISYPFKIREVVAVGNPEILNNDEEIEDALKKANIYDSLQEKEANLDTSVGKEFNDDAIEFSGGEKQRISLAITLAYDHDYLVLDEPTAALDAVSENKMYESFMSGIKDKGSLIVSHRLASARISDRILVFENGEIVQDGNHTDLMQDKDKLYYKMFTAQAKLYKKVQDESKS